MLNPLKILKLQQLATFESNIYLILTYCTGFKNSLFVRTTGDWNQMEEDIIKKKTLKSSK